MRQSTDSGGISNVYVVDSQYRIVFFNDRMKKDFPDLLPGDLCYQTLFKEASPCSRCPLKSVDTSEFLIYQPSLKNWLNITWGEIEWPGAGHCYILVSNKASFKNSSLIPTECTAASNGAPPCSDKDMPTAERPQQPFVHVQSEINEMTGLYNRQAFFTHAAQMLYSSPNRQFCVMSIDIEHFKIFNEWYGQSVGDQFLRNIADRLTAAEEQYDCVAGYMGQDDFVILLPNNLSVLTQLQDEIMQYTRQHGNNAGFLPAFGIYPVTDIEVNIRQMYDRATIAMSSVKGNYARRFAWYDSAMKERMEEDQVLLSEVQRALENREFVFYAQPKCNMISGKIIGLESLVRWRHPVRGIVSPGEFIPLLERNGFITSLDLYVWEMVCQCVRSWIDRGNRPVPISVNVSRVDIYALNVVEIFTQLTDKYSLDTSLIEIEITESAYVKDYNIISDVVDKLRKAGFTVLMDDFGSGYSSLNMLKNVNVDILKIDTKFLDLDENSIQRGSQILESVVHMSRLMGLRVIAEGVETQEQVDFLLSIGCIYAQGYHFYRPMPIHVFEPLLANEENLDYRGICSERIEQLKLQDLFQNNLTSEAMLGNMLGGVAFYDFHDDILELSSVNEQYYRVTGDNPVDLEAYRSRILELIHPEDRKSAMELFHKSRNLPISGAHGILRRFRLDKTMLWLHLHVFFLREQDGHQLYYGAIRNVTDQKMKEQQLAASQESLNAIVGISAHDPGFMKLTEENRKTAASIFSQMTPGGMIGGYCEEGFPLYFANNEMVSLLGYDSYEEFSEGIHGMVANTIHPEDLDRVKMELSNHYYPGMEYTVSYRMPKKDGTWFWTLDKGRVIETDDGRLAIVSACTDITEIIKSLEQLRASNETLLRKNEELHFLNNNMPGGYHRCARTPDFDLLYMSNRFLEIFGFTREEIRDKFDDKFINMVHPEDRCVLLDTIFYTGKSSSVFNLQYRMLSSRGYIWVVDQTKPMSLGSNEFFHGVILDITETVTLKNELKHILDNIPEEILLLHCGPGHFYYRVIANRLLQNLGYSSQQYEKYLNDGAFFNLIHEEDRSRIRPLISSALKRRDHVSELFRLALPNGKALWIDFKATFLEENSDEITYLFVYNDVDSLKRQEEQLWISGKKMESILRQAGLTLWDWDIASHTLTLSNVRKDSFFQKLLPGSPKSEYILRDYPECILKGTVSAVPKSYHSVLKSFLEKAKSSSTAACQLPISVKEQEVFWVNASCETIFDHSHTPLKAVGYLEDITLYKMHERQNLENSKALEILRNQAICDFMVNLSQDAIKQTNSKEAWPQNLMSVEGSSYTKFLNTSCSQMVLPEYQSAVLRFMDRERLIACYKKGVLTDSLEYNRRHHGDERWIKLVVHLVSYEEDPDVYAYVFMMDITAQKHREQTLRQRAETDDLTGLYNRHTAIPMIRDYLQTAVQPRGALIMFDLDNFKQVNDVFGHVYGDRVIVENAKKLQNSFREKDIVCRIGGDEFMVFCRNITPEIIQKKLERIVKNMQTVFCSKDREMAFSVSAGCAVVPIHGTDFEELYHKADVALFQAKLNGKKSYMIYDDSMKSVRYEMLRDTHK